MSAPAWRNFPTCRLADWHDGDTCGVCVYAQQEVDFGFGFKETHYAQLFISARLFGVSAPEVTGSEAHLGAASLKVVSDLFAPGLALHIWTWKLSFTRWVARLVTDDGRDVSREVLRAGGGRAWDGKASRPDMLAKWDPAAEAAEYDRILAREFHP